MTHQDIPPDLLVGVHTIPHEDLLYEDAIIGFQKGPFRVFVRSEQVSRDDKRLELYVTIHGLIASHRGPKTRMADADGLVQLANLSQSMIRHLYKL